MNLIQELDGEMKMPMVGQGVERVEQQSETPVQAKLKELFAPRDEEGSPVAHVSAPLNTTDPSVSA